MLIICLHLNTCQQTLRQYENFQIYTTQIILLLLCFSQLLFSHRCNNDQHIIDTLLHGLFACGYIQVNIQTRFLNRSICYKKNQTISFRLTLHDRINMIILFLEIYSIIYKLFLLMIINESRTLILSPIVQIVLPNLTTAWSCLVVALVIKCFF